MAAQPAHCAAQVPALCAHMHLQLYDTDSGPSLEPQRQPSQTTPLISPSQGGSSVGASKEACRLWRQRSIAAAIADGGWGMQTGWGADLRFSRLHSPIKNSLAGCEPLVR